MFGLLGKVNGLSGLLGGQDGLLGNFGGAPIARGPARAPVQIEGQLPQAVANPGGVQARPGLMQRASDWMGEDLVPGGMSRADALYTLGAGIKDMSPYGRGGNLDAARGMFAGREQQAKAEAERQARAQAYTSAMGEQGFDGDAYLSALAQAGLAPGMEDRIQVEQLRHASRPEYEYFNDESGDRYRYDPTNGGQPERIFDYTDPDAELNKRYKEAQIAAYLGSAAQREAKARQPYAPQRPAAPRAGSVPPPPPGFVIQGGSR